MFESRRRHQSLASLFLPARLAAPRDVFGAQFPQLLRFGPWEAGARYFIFAHRTDSSVEDLSAVTREQIADANGKTLAEFSGKPISGDTDSHRIRERSLRTYIAIRRGVWFLYIAKTICAPLRHLSLRR